MKRNGPQRQRAIKGQPRIPGTGYFDRATEQAIKAEQRRYNVTRSFVLREAVAYALHVATEPQYTYKHRPGRFAVLVGGRAAQRA